jgi:hypothetical protein
MRCGSGKEGRRQARERDSHPNRKMMILRDLRIANRRVPANVPTKMKSHRVFLPFDLDFGRNWQSGLVVRVRGIELAMTPLPYSAGIILEN